MSGSMIAAAGAWMSIALVLGHIARTDNRYAWGWFVGAVLCGPIAVAAYVLSWRPRR